MSSFFYDISTGHRSIVDHDEQQGIRASSSSTRVSSLISIRSSASSARYCLLNPLLMNLAAWPKYFCAQQNVFFLYVNYRTIGGRTHQQHNKDKGEQYPAPARQRPSCIIAREPHFRVTSLPSEATQAPKLKSTPRLFTPKVRPGDAPLAHTSGHHP